MMRRNWFTKLIVRQHWWYHFSFLSSFSLAVSTRDRQEWNSSPRCQMPGVIWYEESTRNELKFDPRWVELRSQIGLHPLAGSTNKNQGENQSQNNVEAKNCELASTNYMTCVTSRHVCYALVLPVNMIRLSPFGGTVVSFASFVWFALIMFPCNLSFNVSDLLDCVRTMKWPCIMRNCHVQSVQLESECEICQFIEYSNANVRKCSRKIAKIPIWILGWMCQRMTDSSLGDGLSSHSVVPRSKPNEQLKLTNLIIDFNVTRQREFSLRHEACVTPNCGPKLHWDVSLSTNEPWVGTIQWWRNHKLKKISSVDTNWWSSRVACHWAILWTNFMFSHPHF